MKRIPLLAIAALLPAVAFAQALDVKTGTWEVTHTIKSSGAPPIPREQLDRMPPERRAMIEKQLQAMAGNGQSRTQRVCVTKEDLERNAGFDDSTSGDCTRKMIAKTSRRREFDETCSRGNRPSTSHVAVVAQDSEHMSGTADSTSPGGFKMHIEYTGHWLGSTCQKKDG